MRLDKDVIAYLMNWMNNTYIGLLLLNKKVPLKAGLSSTSKPKHTNFNVLPHVHVHLHLFLQSFFY